MPTQPHGLRERNRRRRRAAACRWLVVALLAAGPLAAQDPIDDLIELSLEDLMVVQVSLASRSDQPLGTTAAAVQILTRDDLRRSGATSIPELLRKVVGMQVARIDANKWAITARGFNERFANKLLVQIDGRSVYAPAFSGVYLEELGVVLADVERIEVSRGPGATLWGANAVNGVVNIVTQSAATTQGVLVETAAGTEGHDLTVRYGGAAGAARHYRVYATVARHGAAQDTAGGGAANDWTLGRAGGRLDGAHARFGRWHVQTEAVWGSLNNQVRLPQLSGPYFRRQSDPIRVAGGHFLGRWEVDGRGGDRWTTQLSYTLHDREEFVGQRLHTVDLDVQNQRHHGQHRLVWGGGARLARDRFASSLALQVRDPQRLDRRLSLFAQDDIDLAADRLHLIVGTKLEHNSFTGFEVQPTSRLRWSPTPRLTAWGAVSRAVRTPSRGERSVRVILPGAALPSAVLPEGVPAGFAALTGGPDLRSEVVLAWEAGGRFLAAPWLLVDVSTFRHSYDDLRSLHQGNVFVDSTGMTPILILPVVFRNAMSGSSRGLEAAANRWADLTEAERTELDGYEVPVFRRDEMDASRWRDLVEMQVIRNWSAELHERFVDTGLRDGSLWDDVGLSQP